MNNLICTCCTKSLSGGPDTFGDLGREMCWTCHSEVTGMGEPITRSWYGLAPHHHDLSITGGFIGSTVFDPLPEKNTNGEYEIEPGLTFFSDGEADGLMGIWTRVVT